MLKNYLVTVLALFGATTTKNYMLVQLLCNQRMNHFSKDKKSKNPAV